MAQRFFNIGDMVLCYSCEKCRVEKRPRNKKMFGGIITSIDGNIVTVKHTDGHLSHNDIACLELLPEAKKIGRPARQVEAKRVNIHIELPLYDFIISHKGDTTVTGFINNLIRKEAQL